MLKSLLLFSLLASNPVLAAFQNPTNGKPVTTWLWEDQFKPTIQSSYDTTGIAILTSGAAASLAAHEYDTPVYDHNEKHGKKDWEKDTSKVLGIVGNGAIGVGIAVTQIFVDQDNGLKNGRGMALTTATQVSLALATRRDRPGNHRDYLPFASSFPSGHTASAFSTATALSYAYGAKAGIPAFLVASSIGAARIKSDAHWVSDVVSGAFLGIYWGRASYNVKASEKESLRIMPMPIEKGFMLSSVKSF